MYEEDRVRALELYEEIFDEAGNETAMLQLLVSPTRQAVNLARAYDAKARSFQLDDGTEPAYLQVIDDLRRQAGTLSPVLPRQEDGQVSIFDISDNGDDVFGSLGIDEPAENEAAPGENKAVPEEISLFPDEDKDEASAPSLPPQFPADEEASPQAQELDDFSDAVAAFLADFTIHDDFSREAETPVLAGETIEQDTEDEPVAPPSPPDEDQPAPAIALEMPKEEPAAILSPRQQDLMEQLAERLPRTPEPMFPESDKAALGEAKVPLLVLFILAAIPIGLCCAALIAAAAVLSLGIAAAALCGGVGGMIAAFTAFVLFPDILLVFGLSLSLAAIGLLLFWLFIWLLFGGIPGLVRSLIALARKWCYKEVAI